jgi:antitoxin (DNA-binding transcriptional repressor) of toxin-antitoxin stability system
MSTVTIEEAQARLPTLIEALASGESWTIVRGGVPVARLTAVEPAPRQPGLCQGMLTVLAEDDDHLQDFAEYMPSS